MVGMHETEAPAKMRLTALCAATVRSSLIASVMKYLFIGTEVSVWAVSLPFCVKQSTKQKQRRYAAVIRWAYVVAANGCGRTTGSWRSGLLITA